MKQSEEREFKLKEKKFYRKLRSVEKCETKHDSVKEVVSKEELPVTDPCCFNNNHVVPVSSPSQNYTEFITMASYNIARNITTFPSVVSHCIPLLPEPAFRLPPLASKLESKGLREARPRRLWKCDQCAQTFPQGYTADQALHMYEHRKEIK